MPPQNVLLNASEQPREELRRKEREPPTEHDAGNLSLGARLAKHEQQPADHDRP